MIQQHERIASLCEQLKMACPATEWPALALTIRYGPLPTGISIDGLNGSRFSQ